MRSAAKAVYATDKYRSRGEHIGRVPYGYDRINQKLVIHGEEAKVVRDIYNWYNIGWGFK